MELGAGQPLALSCPVTPASCLAALRLVSFSLFKNLYPVTVWANYLVHLGGAEARQ